MDTINPKKTYSENILPLQPNTILGLNYDCWMNNKIQEHCKPQQDHKSELNQHPSLNKVKQYVLHKSFLSISCTCATFPKINTTEFQIRSEHVQLSKFLFDFKMYMAPNKSRTKTNQRDVTVNVSWISAAT